MTPSDKPGPGLAATAVTANGTQTMSAHDRAQALAREGRFEDAEQALRSQAAGDDRTRENQERDLAHLYERWARSSYEFLDFPATLEKLELCLERRRFFSEEAQMRMTLLAAHLHRRLGRNDKCLEQIAKIEQAYAGAKDPYIDNLVLNEREITEGKSFLKSYPSRATIRLTNTCNFRCIMCEMPWEKPWYTPKHIMDDVAFLSQYMEDLQWQGGEIFILDRKFLRGLFERSAENPHLAQSIITNGVLIDKEWAEVLVRCRVSIRISVDGATKEVYEKIRPGSKWDNLMKAVGYLREEMERQGKRVPLDIHMVVMRSNHRQIAQLVEFAKANGFNTVDLSNIMGTHPDEDIFTGGTPEEWRGLEAERALARARALELGIKFGDNLPYAPKEIVAERNTDLKTQSGRPAAVPVSLKSGADFKGAFFCLSAWKKLIVRDFGNISTNWQCDRYIGHVNDGSLLDTWNGPQMQMYRKRIAANTQRSLCTEKCLSGAVTDSWRDQSEWTW